MPNCFTLTLKGDKEPAELAKVDTDLWIKFNGEEPAGNDQWYCHWYDNIGLLLAMGKSFDECIEEYKGNMRKIAIYLKENYTSNAWYQHK